MKYLSIILLIFIPFVSYSDEKVCEKLLAKHVGNWETVIKGKVSINGNVANQLNFNGKRQSKSIFGGKVISSVFTLKGDNFDGGKSDTQGIGFLFWDKEEKTLRTLEIMSSGMAFTALFEVIDESSYKTVFEKQEGVKNSSGIEFNKTGDTQNSFMINETPEFGAVSEMTWKRTKSKDKSFKMDSVISTKTNEKLISYKTDSYNWILNGKFLYSEGSDESGKFISIIGIFPGQTGKKIVIFEDGTIKAYRPINIHTWKEVEIKNQ